MSKETVTNLIVVSPNDLSEEALRGIIESFILREGTDYGFSEYTLEQKVSQVLKQIEQGKVDVIYDLIDESCDLRIRTKI